MDDFYSLSDPYQEGSRAAIAKKQHHRKVAIGVVVTACIALAVMWAFAFGPGRSLIEQAVPGADSGLEKSVMITGLADEPFALNESELAALPVAAETVEGFESLPSAEAAIYDLGPTLATLAEAYGRSLDEFAQVSFVSNTTFSVAVVGDTLKKDLVLTLRMPDGPLPEKYLPMQVILPENGNQNWAFGVISIDFSETIIEPEPEIL